MLDEGPEPVLLVSAGIGQTPLLAMLHRLASERSRRVVWWIHTTHDADSHAFSTEVADLLGRLPSAHSLVYYTAPAQPLAAGSGVRAGTTHRGGDHRPGPPGRRQRVRLRPGAVHGRRRGAPSPASASELPASTPNGSGRGRRSTPASSGRTLRLRISRPGHRAAGPAVTFARSATHGGVVGHVLIGARARRSVRRSHAVVVPHRRLPHLRHSGAVGRGVVRDTAARAARRRRAADLLGTADRGPRDRPLTADASTRARRAATRTTDAGCPALSLREVCSRSSGSRPRRPGPRSAVRRSGSCSGRRRS